MTEYDIFLCVIGALIVLCLVSLTIIVATGAGKGVRIAFCAFSAICLALCVFLELVVLGVITLDFLTPLVDGKKAVALIFALAIVSAGEFAFLLFGRDEKQKKVSCVKREKRQEYKPVHTDNVRKADERKHGEYVIIRGE